jgi:hypothetical protein
MLIQSVNFSTPESFLATGAAGDSSIQPVDSFSQELFQAFSASLVRLGMGDGQTEPANGQDFGASGDVWQFLATVAPGNTANAPVNPFLNYAPFGGESPWQSDVLGVMRDAVTGNNTLFNYTANGPNHAFITAAAADHLASLFGGTVVGGGDSPYGSPLYEIDFGGGCVAAAGQLAFMLARGDTIEEVRANIDARRAAVAVS